MIKSSAEILIMVRIVMGRIRQHFTVGLAIDYSDPDWPSKFVISVLIKHKLN